jgi:beta-glucosidase/6-phospho-beta-glucosidase/beta-galactosidase
MEFQKHFSRQDLENLFDGSFSLPDDFMFGVANAGFQVEGGYNGPGEPLNNWADWERAEKVERSGEAVRFWADYAQHVELAKEMGLNALRMGFEWSRVQPTVTTKCCTIPPFDEKAIEGYAEIVASVMRAGMEPVVTLHHFTHPLWLGIDFWLQNEKLDLFTRYVEEVTRGVNTLLVEKHGLRPIKYYVTINEPNGLAPGSYAVMYFPHRRAGVKNALLALSNLIDGHCRAYDAVHAVHRENGWAEPMVTYNTIHFSLYTLDKMVTDLMNARRNGVERRDLTSYLSRGRSAWEEEIARCPVVWKPPRLNVWAEHIVSRLLDRVMDSEHLQNGVDALYASPEPRKLDYLAVDYYDSYLRYMFKAPGIQDIKERRFSFNQELWEQVLNPAALYHFLKAETINGDGLPLIILENGMCYRVRDGLAERRYDGATMDTFLQAYLYEVMRALKDGLPLKGYFWWTMVDNYEWGSYEPRFGLHAADRTKSPVEILGTDAFGVNAGKAYGDLIAAIKSGEPDRAVEAFLRDGWR